MNIQIKGFGYQVEVLILVKIYIRQQLEKHKKKLGLILK
jgi:hypothetical protein